jgi:uncharacterized protein (DUF488 family)
MYHRHKILLSLIDAFDGSLSNTDCQKLIFLLCQRTGSNYYDFFPYQYGGFSHVLYEDKRYLIKQGNLEDQDRFKLSNKPSLYGVSQKEREALQEIKLEVGAVRGDKLVEKIYYEFPYYASRSKIALDIFPEKEWEKKKRQWETNDTFCLFTIGYEGISIDSYLNKLIKNNVKSLIDVRNSPYSRKFGFSQSKLKPYVKALGIEYTHLPELGVPFELRKNINDPDAYSNLFEFYKKNILPRQSEAVDKIRDLVKEHKRVALTCFEADPSRCHRHLITEYLEHQIDFPHPIVHIN